jgi:ribosomal-protein-alanine N-acetyltransferase
MDTSVEPGRPDDAPELARIARASFPDPWSEAVLRAELERPSSVALVARAGGEVAGYALGWRVHDEVQLLSFAVAPAHRRRGVGRALLARYVDELRAAGVRRLTLEVRESNLPALALYRRLGLAHEGARPRYYPGGETALLYGARL